MKPKLVRPNVIYKTSFLRAWAEFAKDGSSLALPDRAEVAGDFPAYVKKIRGWAQGKNLRPGYVPESVYWLVDGNKYIGKISIRHRLTPHLRRLGGHIGYEIRSGERQKGYGTMILRLALLKARQLGLKKVLLTCDETNLASRKIIVKNGGVLENKASRGRGLPKRLRFWIWT